MNYTGVVDEAPINEFPEIHNFPKFVLPNLSLTSNIPNKKEKHGFHRSFWGMYLTVKYILGALLCVSQQSLCGSSGCVQYWDT